MCEFHFRHSLEWRFSEQSKFTFVPISRSGRDHPMVATHTWKTIKHGSKADDRGFLERSDGRPETHKLVMLLAELDELVVTGAPVSNRSLAEAAARLAALDDAAELDGFDDIDTNAGLPQTPEDEFSKDTDGACFYGGYSHDDDDLGYYEFAPTHLLSAHEVGIKPLNDCVGTTGQVDCPNGYYSGDDEYLGDTSPGGFLVRYRP